MNRSPEILVVDDELGIREGCKRALARLGYVVDLAEDGAAGLRKVQQKQYDLILMDLMMPGIGGLDLIKKVHDIDAEIIIVAELGLAPTTRQRQRRQHQEQPPHRSSFSMRATRRTSPSPASVVSRPLPV